MRYEGDIYRPPSEAYSLLIQATIGCSWNKCKFCTMYKNKRFRPRKMEDIRRDLVECSRYQNRFKRIFLCDGDAFVLSAPKLLEILGMIRKLFPNIQGVRSYASARNILLKTPEELKAIREAGLDLVYIGLETGNDEILSQCNKGTTRAEMIKAGQMLKKSGISQSVSIIAGMGGEDHWQEHMRDTATALNGMQPERLGLLVLTPGGERSQWQENDYRWLDGPPPLQVMREMQLLVENLQLEDCYFSSAHISNYINVKAHLPQDKAELLDALAQLLASVA